MTRAPFLSASGRDGIVLVVDDVERNLQIVGELLTQQHYEVMLATSGEAAIERVRARKPDLILLDVMMPGIDGIEVCRRLQLDPATQDIPIIFVTAAHDSDLAVQGLNEGGVDYVTKPFHAPELLARVATHVALKQSRDLSRRIIAEKNDLMAAVAHDLKNPLSSIRMAARSLRLGLTEDPRAEMADIIVESCEELLGLIEERLTRNAREAAIAKLHLSPIDLRVALQAVVQQNRPSAHAKNIELTLDWPGETVVHVMADFHALTQIFDNLVSNAVKFSPPGKPVTVLLGGSSAPGLSRVKVRDHGPGCSTADREKLFLPYQRLSARPTAGESSTGLGLSIARDMTVKMGGRIDCEDTEGGGATFWVELPTATA